MDAVVLVHLRVEMMESSKVRGWSSRLVPMRFAVDSTTSSLIRIWTKNFDEVHTDSTRSSRRAKAARTRTTFSLRFGLYSISLRVDCPPSNRPSLFQRLLGEVRVAGGGRGRSGKTSRDQGRLGSRVWQIIFPFDSSYWLFGYLTRALNASCTRPCSIANAKKMA